MIEVRWRDGRCAVSWSYVPTHVHHAYVAYIKRVAGAEFSAQDKCWYIPAHNVDRLVALFPDASYDYDALCALVDAERRRTSIFARNLLALGCVFEVCGDHLAVYGEGVSPLIEQLVEERRVQLLALFREVEQRRAQRQAQPQPQPSSAAPTPTDDDAVRQAELLATALRNAARRARQKQMMAEPPF